jgi:hypothetical protein
MPPIRYVAEVAGTDTDRERAIRWLIILMVICCDTFAIALTALRTWLAKGKVNLSICSDREEKCSDPHALPNAREPSNRLPIKTAVRHVFSRKSRTEQ